jgi:hypothetical protein
MIQWKEKPISENILNILIYGYKLTIGHIQFIQEITNPIISHFARTGNIAAEMISRESRILGNIFLLPVSVIFILEIIKSAKKKEKRSWLIYILAGIGIPLSIMLLPIILGGNISVRQQFALPFSFAFMMYYIIKKHKKYLRIIIGCIGIMIAIYQAETTSQLFYTDYRRYQKDVYFSGDIDKMIRDSGYTETKNLPLVLIGKYQPKFEFNYLYGDVIGYSSFGWINPKDYYESTERGLAFMNSLGLNYKMPNKMLMNKAREASKSMSNYPNLGCVKLLDDVIVVKISNSVYSP